MSNVRAVSVYVCHAVHVLHLSRQVSVAPILGWPYGFGSWCRRRVSVARVYRVASFLSFVFFFLVVCLVNMFPGFGPLLLAQIP